MKGSSALNVNWTTNSSHDFYHEVYDDPVFNWFMIGLYILGWIAAGILNFMSWFERNGEAGPYRTLFNRLMTYIFDQLTLYYLFCTGPFTLRAVTGPLPTFVCEFSTFMTVFTVTNISMILFTRTAFKFYFACWFKSVPVMEDDFLAVFTYLASSFLAVLATSSKLYIDTAEGLPMMVCNGLNPDLVDIDGFRFPLVRLAMIFGLVGHFLLSIPLGYEKYFKNGGDQQPLPFNHQLQNTTNLGGWVIGLFIILFCPTITVFFRNTSINIDDLNNQMVKLSIHAMNTLVPVALGWILSVIFLVTRPHFRKVLERFVLNIFSN